MAIPPGLILLGFAPVFVAGILRGITGFGILLVATPLLFLILPPKLVIAAMIPPALAASLAILWRDGIPWAHLPAYGALFGSGAVGALIGVLGLVVLDRRAIFLIVAGYIVVFLLLQYRGDVATAVLDARGMAVVAGGSGGLLGGTVGLAGPPIVTYLHAKPLEKRPFVGLLTVYFLIIGIVRIPSMYATGLFGLEELVLGATFTVPALVGTYVGAMLRPRVPQHTFERAVEGFLLLVAVKLVIDGLSIQLW